MKKLILAVFAALFSLAATAQNIQLHYDFADGRKMLTSTVEMFKLDDYGSTYFFIDMDYGTEDSGVDGISMAYWEVSRSIKIGNFPIQPRVEYNGGLGRGGFETTDGFGTYSYAINDAFLGGAQATWLSKDFTKNFTLSANYKLITNRKGDTNTDIQHSFQITGVWGMNFFNDKLSFLGFADFWKEDVEAKNDKDQTVTKDFVFVSEPQLWFNINKAFSVGGELELSNNFGGTDGFKACPTVAVKWNI